MKTIIYATRVEGKTKDVDLEELGKIKEILKREGNGVKMFPHQTTVKR